MILGSRWEGGWVLVYVVTAVLQLKGRFLLNQGRVRSNGVCVREREKSYVGMSVMVNAPSPTFPATRHQWCQPHQTASVSSRDFATAWANKQVLTWAISIGFSIMYLDTDRKYVLIRNVILKRIWKHNFLNKSYSRKVSQMRIVIHVKQCLFMDQL